MALHFDGTDARLTSTDSVGFPSGAPISMACVVRFDAVSRWHGLIQCAHEGVSRAMLWEINNSNQFFLKNNGGAVSLTSSGTVAANIWYFCGISVIGTGGSDTRYYCYNLETQASVFDATGTAAGFTLNAASAGDDYIVGAWSSNGSTYGDFTDGQIAWAAVYNKNFWASENMLALAHRGPYAMGEPVALWTMLDDVDGGTSTTVREVVNNNTGTLTNFNFDANGGWRAMNQPGPWWTWHAPRVIRAQAAAAAGHPAMRRLGMIPQASRVVGGRNVSIA